MLTWPPKDPDEVLFYEFDWTNRLASGETILASDWEVAEGTVEIAASPAPTLVGAVTKLYLEGGALGETCIVTNFVETNLNPRRDFSAKLKIKAK